MHINGYNHERTCIWICSKCVGQVYRFLICFTNYVVAVPVPNKDTLVVAKAFYRTLILVHGAPGRVTADDEGEFVSTLMKRLSTWLQSDYHITTPFRPPSNVWQSRTVAQSAATYHPDLLEIFRRRCELAGPAFHRMGIKHNSYVGSWALAI